jgi:hypothetical protein
MRTLRREGPTVDRNGDNATKGRQYSASKRECERNECYTLTLLWMSGTIAAVETTLRGRLEFQPFQTGIVKCARLYTTLYRTTTRR